MNVLHAYLGFAGAAAIVVVTPGPDTTLVLRTVISHNRSMALRVALGCCSGVVFWASAAAFAFPMLRGVPRGSSTLSAVGAAYLIWLALRPWIRTSTDGQSIHRSHAGLGFRQGLISNLLNPKIGAFYLSVLPIFIPAGYDERLFALSLAALQGIEAILWFAALLWLTSGFLPRPGSYEARLLDAAFSVVLVGCALLMLGRVAGI